MPWEVAEPIREGQYEGGGASWRNADTRVKRPTSTVNAHPASPSRRSRDRLYRPRLRKNAKLRDCRFSKARPAHAEPCRGCAARPPLLAHDAFVCLQPAFDIPPPDPEQPSHSITRQFAGSNEAVGEGTSRLEHP